MKLLQLFHRHLWSVLFRSNWGRVEQCLSCHEYRTYIKDYSKKEMVFVPGNLIAPALSNTVFILCGNLTQFQEALKQLKDLNISIHNFRNLTKIDQLKGIRYPTIYLYGYWYENELCQDPEFTTILNGWL